MQRHIIRLKLKDLRKNMDVIIDEYLQKMTQIILKSVRIYPIDWDNNYSQIENLFYDFLIEIYNVVNNHLKSIYKVLPDLKVEDIYNFTYDIDGKHLTQRLKEYWQEGANRLSANSDDTVNVSNYLINMYDRILFTESRVVESKLKKVKRPDNASLLVIEAGCDICVGGEYPPDEDILLPPFHPNCNCEWYYEVANEEDIHDLDLEYEE